MKRIIVYGITGSIGESTVKILTRFPEEFTLIGCSAGKNSVRLKELQSLFPSISKAVLADSEGMEGLFSLLDLSPDLVVMALPGKAGWKITLEAIRRNIPVALANKEALVIAGYFLGKEITSDRSRILPVDSEHAALMQVMEKNSPHEIKKAWITASGGALFTYSSQAMLHATAQQALKHPVWDMGKKVTIDSATMVNKGLELMEAFWLFHLEPQQLGVLVHPQVAVHAMAECIDGSIICQIAPSDMVIPIAAALSYPGVLPLSDRFSSLSVSFSSPLSFFEPDLEKYRLLKLAFDLLLELDFSGMVAYAISDEVAVDAFLRDEITVGGIYRIVEETVGHFRHLKKPASVREIDSLIQEIELCAAHLLGQRS